jgi:biopolymer transport protein ExbB
MNTRTLAALLAGMIAAVATPAQEHQDQGQQPQAAEGSFAKAATSIQQQLNASLEELSKLREQIAAEKIPLSKELNGLEAELSKVRLDYQQKTRLLDASSLDLTNLRAEVKTREEDRGYLGTLVSEYVRNFESRLHIAELQRYKPVLDAVKLASGNSNLPAADVFKEQAALLSASLDRLEDALGGTRFEGTAVVASGLVKHGTFVLMGPSALFRADDGSAVGTVEQRLGSLEPTAVTFESPEDTNDAAQVVANSNGVFPLDPTLGNAHKVEAIHETLLAHVKKGGPVMVPIFALAGAALLVALYKWFALMFVRRPSRRRVQKLLEAVARGDKEGALEEAEAIRGPGGRMLAAGVEHLGEPRELIEEIMYERVLSTRLKLNSMLPFVAITASSAPLLGLLGTVTGIMKTFALMTVFGTGDVKTLSSGISEALITTEYGLYVAIPSLLLHAFLSRKARGVIDQMEKAAIAFVNQVGKTPYVLPRKEPRSRHQLEAGFDKEGVAGLRPAVAGD